MHPDDPASQPGPPATSGREKLFFALLFGGLFALVAGLIVTYELDPTAQPLPKLPWGNGRLSHKDVITVFMVMCGMGALGALGGGLVRHFGSPGRRARNVARGLLVAVVLLAGFNYFYGRQGLYASQFAHRWDTFHYFMGPRYYAEIDYADLYVCALEDISARHIPDSNHVRDLRNYHMVKAGELRAQDLCPDSFDGDRRRRWQADLKVYTDNGGHRVLRQAIEDRGYNGTPFHSVTAGAIADRIPFTQATHQLMPLIDIGLISLMLIGVCWGFGWEIGLFFALMVFANAADRYGIIGGSYLRFQWLWTTALALAALRRGRHATSGLLMALATLTNVFPVVFSVGIFVRGVVETWRQRSVPVRYRRFFAAAIVTGVLGLGVGAVPARGVDNYASWRENMALHNVERFQGFGTGLKFPFIYRGHNSAKTDKFPERQRKQWFHAVRPWYYALATVVIGLAVGFAARTRDDVEASAVVGFTLFFGVLGTVGYYFAIASVMVLALHRRSRQLGGAVLLALFFVASLLAHWALYETLYYRFTYNTVLSTSWTVWLVLLLGWLAWKERVLSPAAWKETLRRP